MEEDNEDEEDAGDCGTMALRLALSGTGPYDWTICVDESWPRTDDMMELLGSGVGVDEADEEGEGLG